MMTEGAVLGVPMARRERGRMKVRKGERKVKERVLTIRSRVR